MLIIKHRVKQEPKTPYVTGPRISNYIIGVPDEKSMRLDPRIKELYYDFEKNVFKDASGKVYDKFTWFANHPPKKVHYPENIMRYLDWVQETCYGKCLGDFG